MLRPLFFFSRYCDHRDLHSFPTRRSSDLDQVYAQNEMLAYQQKESTARVASIMENTNLSKQQQERLEFSIIDRSEERFSRNAETDLVCRLLLEKKKVISLFVFQKVS